MATIPGALLLVASSPYARRGPLYDAYRRYYGKDGSVLVWKAPTWIMNPALPRDSEVIADAFEADPANAAAEFGAEFRRDIETYVAREVIEAAISPGRFELPPASGVRYSAACDPSGGTADSFGLAIVHVEKGGRLIVDAVRERRAPFAPDAVTQEFAAVPEDLPHPRGRRRSLRRRVAARTVQGIWRELPAGRKAEVRSLPDLLPLLNSGRVELLDNPRLAAQFCGFERRTSRGGKVSIDHPPGATAADDLCNAVASALVHAAIKRPMIIPDELVRLSAIPDPTWHQSRLNSSYPFNNF